MNLLKNKKHGMQTVGAALFAVLLWGSAWAAPETAETAPKFPVYKTGAEVTTACEAALSQAVADKKRLEESVPPEALLAAIDDLFIASDDVMGPLDLLTNVHPDKAIREAAEGCTVKYQAFRTDFNQSRVLYDKLRALKPKDAIDARYRQDLLDNFVDAGVGLPPAKRAEAKDLSDRMTKVSLAFDRHVREDKTQLAFTADELKGVPEAVWKDRPQDAQGRYLIGVDNPSYTPVMENAVNAATRERMYRAKLNVGGEANIKLLSELAQMRKQYAALFGFDSYDSFALRRRMAKTPQRVEAFLTGVKNAVSARERSDINVLRRAKAQDLGLTTGPLPPLERWDVDYITQRVKRAKYAVDQDMFRPYFPPEESLKFVFALAERLFGVRFEQVQQELWSPDVKAWHVFDVASGKYLATLYTDMYPRANKYEHYATWSYRDNSTRTGRRPAAALVGNFDRKGLTIDELETVLHEFGHSLHCMLSETRYAGEGGTNVMLDFVEAPSQMLEEWVYHPEVLALFQQVCPSCKPVPPELIRQADAARSFGKGVRYARQELYASYDLALHGKTLHDPQRLWARMESATPLGHVKGTMLPAGFTHLSDGYAAGYYGYLWSEVVAKDLQSAFAGHMLDPAYGMRYRESVLQNGGQRLPDDLLRQFLGRDTNGKAFYAFLKK